jgi:DNA-binding NarL/FixJ family response regulator
MNEGAMKPTQVMIIDDHPGVRSLIRELLQDCFAAMSRGEPAVIECASAEEALHALQNCQPDLATVDLRMGGMDGLECVRRLREVVPRAIVIVVTSMQGDSVVPRSTQAGADGVVFKDELTALQTVVVDHMALMPS